MQNSSPAVLFLQLKPKTGKAGLCSLAGNCSEEEQTSGGQKQIGISKVVL